MDWLSLVGQVVTKDKDDRDSETSEASVSEVLDDLKKPDGELDDLETHVLLSILDTLSLQLNILHARNPDHSIQSNKISAKKYCAIIEQTISQLKETGTFEHLSTTVQEELKERRTDSRVARSNAESEKKIRQLQYQIRSNDKIKMRDMNKKEEIIASLKDEVQNLIAQSEAKIRYVDRWQNAQQGENLMRCDNAEMELKWKLESMTVRYNNEIIIGDKIRTFLAGQIEALETEIDNWKIKYKEEMKNRTEKIVKLQKKSREQQFHLQELKSVFNDHQKEMEDYLKFKAERIAEEERIRFIHKSATKIQAWWRGTMVRRGLGPYKKRKKATKDKKKKDK